MSHSANIKASLPIEGLETWLDRYGLEESPFRLSIDPAEGLDSEVSFNESQIYKDTYREQALNQIDHLCRFANGVSVLSGVEGSGRSLVCECLRQRLQGDVQLSYLSAELLLTPEQVFGQLSRDFDCAVSADAAVGEIMAAIRHLLRVDGAEPLVLIVDDAHLLDDALLGALLSMQSGIDGVPRNFHMVLSGDEDLASRLDAFAAVDVLIQDLPLPVLTEQQAVEYLQFKWGLANTNQPLPLSESQLSQLWRKSRGVPKALDALVEAELAEANAVALSRAGLPILHLFALVTLVSFLLIAFFYRDVWYGSESADSQLETDVSGPSGGALSSAAGVADKPKPDKSVVKGANNNQEIENGNSGAIKVANEVANKETAKVSIPLPLNLAPMEGEPSEEKALLPASGAPNGELSVAESGEAIPEAVAITSAAQAQVQKGQMQGGKIQEKAQQPDTATRLEAVKQPEPSVQPELSKKPEPSNKQFEPSNKQPRPVNAVPVAELSVTTTANEPSLTPAEQALMALPQNNYVLQVMAAGSQEAADQFLARQANKSELRVYQSVRRGKPLYLVVVGSFTDRQAAQDYKARLPTEQRQAGPWVRPVADVQRDIKERHSG